MRLSLPSERLFRTHLRAAARQPPNFGGHYRFTTWGCGSNCIAGAVVDLHTGEVFPPPLGGRGDGWSRWIITPSVGQGQPIRYQRGSRLMVVYHGFGWSERRQRPSPDTDYFAWEGRRFRRLLHVPGEKPKPALGSKN